MGSSCLLWTLVVAFLPGMVSNQTAGSNVISLLLRGLWDLVVVEEDSSGPRPPSPQEAWLAVAPGVACLFCGAIPFQGALCAQQLVPQPSHTHRCCVGDKLPHWHLPFCPAGRVWRQQAASQTQLSCQQGLLFRRVAGGSLALAWSLVGTGSSWLSRHESQEGEG